MRLPAFMPFTLRNSTVTASLWGAALGGLVLVFGVDRPTWASVEAPSCPGLVDAIAVWTARLAPRVSVQSIAGAINAVGLVFACIAFAALVRPLTGRLALAATLAMAVATPALSRGAFISAAVPFACACMALRATSRPRSLAAWAALSAACVPGAALPLAAGGAIAIWILRHEARLSERLAFAGAAGLAIFASAWTGGALVPPLAGFGGTCEAPHLFAAARDVGPATVALVVLGLIDLRGRVSARVAIAAGALALGVASALFWLLAAAGMHALLRFGARTRGLAPGSIVVIIVLVALHHAGITGGERRTESPSPMRTASSSTMVDISSALPPASHVVIEDALADLLWRSIRDTKGLRHVPAARDAVAGALTRGDVFALPSAQARLQYLGFQTKPASPSVPGIARVSAGGDCTAPDFGWRMMSLSAQATGLSLSSSERSGRGPVVVYLSFASRPAITRYAWPEGLERGLFVDHYSLAQAADRDRLSSQTTADDLDSQSPALTGPHVVRIELWRTERAPFVLPVSWDRTAAHGVVRRHQTASDDPLLLCPTFVGPIERLPPAR